MTGFKLAVAACSKAGLTRPDQAMPLMAGLAGTEQDPSAMKLYTLSMRLEMYIDQSVWQALSR